jgi:sensor histidine kinase YesM
MNLDSTSPAAAESELSVAERDLLSHRQGRGSLHPLELFAFFRRYPRSPLRTLVYTVIFNCLIAAFFTLMAVIFVRFKSWSQFGDVVLNNLVTANLIGFLWALVMAISRPLLNRINRLPFAGAVASYTVFGFFVTLGSFLLISLLPGFNSNSVWEHLPQLFGGTLAISFLISLVLGFAFRARIGALERDAAQARERERLQIVERQAVQANLRALQAQIEPHFLFNSLANVVGLIHADPDKAKLMLEKFIVYLRATLDATRASETTLGHEFETMQNFLAILQIRMGARLHYKLDLPPALAAAKIPPMLLQPLVENALKHGLEPKIEGGEVSLSAQRDGEQLLLVVADSGLGFHDSMSNGIGLKNVRERLHQLYDGRATLRIEDNVPCGTRISISIPCEIQTS